MNSSGERFFVQLFGCSSSPVGFSNDPVALPVALRHTLRLVVATWLHCFLTRVTTPYLDERGTLIIPTDSDPKYHYWKGGQSVVTTLKELSAPLEVIRRFVNDAEFEKLKAQGEKAQVQAA